MCHHHAENLSTDAAIIESAADSGERVSRKGLSSLGYEAFYSWCLLLFYVQYSDLENTVVRPSFHQIRESFHSAKLVWTKVPGDYPRGGFSSIIALHLGSESELSSGGGGHWARKMGFLGSGRKSSELRKCWGKLGEGFGGKTKKNKNK